MEQLRQEVEKLVTLSDEEWAFIASKFTYRQIPKDQIIHPAGEIFSKTFYIQSGVARAYLVDPQGKEFTWQLYFRDATSAGSNHFLDDSVSYYEQQGSFLTFETLEDTELYEIEISELDRLFDADPKFEKMARMYMHDHFFTPMYKRTLSVMTEDAQTRYARLLAEHPNIFQYVKAYHVASYLGVAPQTLSKLRKMNLGE
uniref:Crp/Fnr family transcriptional regulator n=1 Tax=Thaumasiovibrio occultus TaxID=1891184 RepID=UPI000B35B465|nr:Crp/Fnr family transcriptional regulator [Thaumasiovibrio occultus]